MFIMTCTTLPPCIPAKHSETFLLLCLWRIWNHHHDMVFRPRDPSLGCLLNSCKEDAALWTERMPIWDRRVKNNDLCAFTPFGCWAGDRSFQSVGCKLCSLISCIWCIFRELPEDWWSLKVNIWGMKLQKYRSNDPNPSPSDSLYLCRDIHSFIAEISKQDVWHKYSAKFTEDILLL